MAPESVILCGGVGGADPSPAGALRLSIYGPRPNIHFRLEELRRDLWREIPPELRDLLDLAAYVYTADQAVERAGGGRADGDQIGDGWRRSFRFRVPVRLPGLWASGPARQALIDVLSFLSEDTYEFEFTRLAGDPSLDGFLDFAATPYDGRIDEVVMFSGGLDSLAGAVVESVVGERRALLVNHRSNEKLTPRHADLLRGLADRAAGRTLHYPVRMNKSKELGREHTQRTRSFLFASFGALFAHMIGLPRLRFYENGVVSLNLPPSAQVVGARASRTTHPRVLDGFGRLFTAVLGVDFRVENPFLWDTKADVVGRIAAARCAHLIGLSTSCGHTWARTARHPHCGVCSQCLDRRFAVLAAAQEGNDPGCGYAVDLLTGPRRPGEPRTMLAAYLDLANTLERMSEEQFVREFGELNRVLPYLNLPVSTGAGQAFDLYRRHARGVTEVLDRAIATRAREIRRGELPRNCLLRLVTDEGGPCTGGSEDGPPRPAGNAFVRRGEGWVIRYGSGRENYYPMERGFALLRVLLSHPGVAFSATELFARATAEYPDAPRAVSTAEALAGGVGVSVPAGVDALDSKAIDALRARLGEIRQLRAAFAENGSPEAVDHMDELAAEEQRITEHLRRALGRGGRSRKLGDPDEKARKRVRNALTRALALIDDDDKPLAEHLTQPALTIGGTLIYKPMPSTMWAMED